MSKAVDAVTVTSSIVDTVAKVCPPLTDDQRMVIAGALAVWLDKARHAARAEALREAAEFCSIEGSLYAGSDCGDALLAMADREGK